MKFTLLFVFLLSSIFVFGKKPGREIIGCEPIYKHRVFMAATEVSNLNYREFLFDLERKGIETKSLLPDTTAWRNKGSYNEPYVEYYFRHPAYNDYPVVGVTKRQAEAFCDWLSVILTNEYRKNEKSDVDSVVVRLPSKQEWMDAAKGGNDYYEYPWKGHSLRWEEGKFQGMFRANCIRGRGDYMGIAGSLNNNADVTAPVKSYWPNDYGLYNCSGNVAEMVADDNVAMGGSWSSYGNDIKVTSEMPADSSSARIGFRYLVEVVRLKPGKKSPSIDISKRSFVKENLVEINDSLWVSKFEVNNQLYNQFLRESSRAIQDTTLWDSAFIYSNWFTCNYRWHSKYANYPAVGMSREDVDAFSVWMTVKLERLMGVKLEVTLPTEGEWEMIARGGLELSPYPWGGPYIRNKKGELLANHRYVPSAFETVSPKGEYSVILPNGRHQMYGADLDGYLGCAPVDSYHPNGFGVYNCGGNVREMVLDNDSITKGGGWYSSDYFMRIGSKESIEKTASPDIGFRYVVRILN